MSPRCEPSSTRISICSSICSSYAPKNLRPQFTLHTKLSSRVSQRACKQSQSTARLKPPAMRILSCIAKPSPSISHPTSTASSLTSPRASSSQTPHIVKMRSTGVLWAQQSAIASLGSKLQEADLHGCGAKREWIGLVRDRDRDGLDLLIGRWAENEMRDGILFRLKAKEMRC